jgi:uncharacterized damage-inducible protein DinB
MMTSPAASQLVWLLDEAFAGENWHSLVNNVKAADERDWNRVPDGGDRSIREIVEHVGVCKIMYDNHAFGDGHLTWDDQLVEDEASLSTIPSAIEWLRSCHGQLRQSVAALSDDELSRPRKTHVGTMKETRWLIAVMIEHDLYHSGEINLIRSLCGRETVWRHYL